MHYMLLLFALFLTACNTTPILEDTSTTTSVVSPSSVSTTTVSATPVSTVPSRRLYRRGKVHYEGINRF